MAYNMLDSLLRGKSDKGPGATQPTGGAGQAERVNLQYISARDLVPSKDNFYSLEQIEELAMMIELAGKVMQNLTVVPLDGGKYKVIAGHRRRLAVLLLMERGKAQFEFMPCDVEATEADAEMQEIRDGIQLIVANSQRVKTDWDKVEEARRMRSLLERLNDKERVPGDKRKIIAQALRTTPAQIGRYDAIAKNLVPEFQEEMQAGKLGISAAYEISGFPEDEQRRIFAEYQNGGGLRYTEARQIKEELKPKEEKRQQDPAPPSSTPEVHRGQQDRVFPASSPETDTVHPPEAPAPAEPPERAQDVPPAPPSSPATEPEKAPEQEAPAPSPAPLQRDEAEETAQAVKQLESLRDYCQTMDESDTDGGSRVWALDVDALEVAIARLKRG